MNEFEKKKVGIILKHIENTLNGVSFIGDYKHDKKMFAEHTLEPVMKSIEEIKDILNQEN